jgi:phenylacetate-CoA ligase
MLKRIEGRLQDFVVSKTNRYVSLTGVYGLVAESSLHVKECQLYQDTKGEIVISIVKRGNYSDSDTYLIQKNFQKRFGDEFKILVNLVDDIPRTSRGKYQFLIQRLPIEFGPNLNSQL